MALSEYVRESFCKGERDQTMTGFLKLWISGQELDLDEISERLKTDPSHLYKKGDTHYDKITKETITYVEDRWLLDKEIETENLEQEVLDFISLFAHNTEYIKSLSEKHTVFLWLSVYPETEQYSVCFSTKVIEEVYKLGLSIGINVADLRAFYDGTH